MQTRKQNKTKQNKTKNQQMSSQLATKPESQWADQELLLMCLLDKIFNIIVVPFGTIISCQGLVW